MDRIRRNFEAHCEAEAGERLDELRIFGVDGIPQIANAPLTNIHTCTRHESIIYPTTIYPINLRNKSLHSIQHCFKFQSPHVRATQKKPSSLLNSSKNSKKPSSLKASS